MWGYNWIPMTMDWIDTEICKSWQEKQKRSSTTFEKMLVSYSSVYFFKLLNLYAKFLYLKMTWGGEKISRFYCWFLFHNVYQRNFLLEKVKNYFPKSKVTTHCNLCSVANWFGIWGKRSHWPCVMEGLLLWGKSWVRLFILMTFIFFLFSCLANHKARNSITLIHLLLRCHNLSQKSPKKLSWNVIIGSFFVKQPLLI